jgi:uncharacterized membrane protein SpoIIM required for sporulation/uncharacterized RDD family membrane protein YckC
VVFSYTIAGVGSRVYAALIDYFLCFVLLIGIFIFLAALIPDGPRTGPQQTTSSEAWAMAFFVIAQFVVLWGYYVLFEALADGQTPGKKILRLRVVRDGGYSIDFGASAVRNIVRLVDMQPVFFYGVGIASIIASKTGRRLGDIVAGTIVVREELVRQLAPPPVPQAHTTAAAPEAPVALHTSLGDEEYDVLERFMQRRGTLDASRRSALAAQLAERLSNALATQPEGVRAASDSARLVRLYESERDARARGVATRNQRGAARERHVIVATSSPRWNAFSAKLADAQRRKLSALGEEGVRSFVADYRDLSADLARLQTAARGKESAELFYLSRLVSGAHNLLYRRQSITLFDIVRFLTVDAPREVLRSWVPITLAAALLFGPAAIAYTAVVRDPSVVGVFIPPQMLDRAEEGVRSAREGRGYIKDPQIFRPVMATSIIANNVQVSFMAFAMGITAGIGTLLILVLNGVSLGGIMGLYASKGIARLLIAFVAPHGVLELTAVCIAGGAGFLLAAAILMPGRRTRRRALKENGGRAIRLVAAATVLLLVAGTLEGFVSPIETWPLSAKLAVSAATAVLLVVYLSGGRRKPRTPAEAAADRAAGAAERGELLGLGTLGSDAAERYSAPRALMSR